MSIKILASPNIPHVHDAFATIGEVTVFPGRSIDRDLLAHADALVIRSEFKVTGELLEGTRVRFVGTSTIGTDHIDLKAVADLGVGFSNAPASNADSVVDFVTAALLELAVTTGEAMKGKTLGIVGHGSIGSRLAIRAPRLGLSVLVNDPPLRASGASPDLNYVELPDLVEQADIISLHVPLIREGVHPTRHLLGASQLAGLRSDQWLVNASRGPVVDGDALKSVLLSGPLQHVVLDVWENEPTPDPALVELVSIGTGHIAGHAIDAKLNGTKMMADAVADHFGLESPWTVDDVLGTERNLLQIDEMPNGTVEERQLYLVRQMYDIRIDDAWLRDTLSHSADERARRFKARRSDYPVWRTFGRHRLPQDAPEYLGYGIGLSDLS